MKPRRRHGVTLIETIIAIVVLSIALPPMLWSIREAQIQRANPVLSSRARWLAVSKLEDVIADRHSTTRGYDYLIGANYSYEPTLTGYAGFSRRVVLNETLADLATPGDGHMNVSVEVSWTDANGTNQTLDVATVLTEYVP
ncbi:MAG: type II secretion system protein [Planctomycetota bacterium]|nr:type II secretion system protein [Planctomycetota bacterium]